MTNKEYEQLKNDIGQKMHELAKLQDKHIEETGVVYVPGFPVFGKLKKDN